MVAHICISAPVSSEPPQVSEEHRTLTLARALGSALSLLCRGQSYPIPEYRCVTGGIWVFQGKFLFREDVQFYPRLLNSGLQLFFNAVCRISWQCYITTVLYPGIWRCYVSWVTCKFSSISCMLSATKNNIRTNTWHYQSTSLQLCSTWSSPYDIWTMCTAKLPFSVYSLWLNHSFGYLFEILKRHNYLWTSAWFHEPITREFILGGNFASQILPNSKKFSKNMFFQNIITCISNTVRCILIQSFLVLG